MQTPSSEAQLPTKSRSQYALLELAVNNQPGVMLHICSLFARRAFNLEGILCLPSENGKHGRVWLLVRDDHRLDQVVKQLLKLADVLSVQRRSADPDLFVQVERFFWPSVTV